MSEIPLIPLSRPEAKSEETNSDFLISTLPWPFLLTKQLQRSDKCNHHCVEMLYSMEVFPFLAKMKETIFLQRLIV